MSTVTKNKMQNKEYPSICMYMTLSYAGVRTYEYNSQKDRTQALRKLLQ